MNLKEKVQIALLIGGSCIGAIVLQNFEGWHRKNVLANVEPEMASGKVVAVDLLPSNTGTSYSVSVDLETGEKATLIAGLALARSCKIGEVIQIEKRGMDYHFAKEGCGVD